MKRPKTKQRHRPEEVLAMVRQADEALSKGVTISKVAQTPFLIRANLFFANRIECFNDPCGVSCNH